MEGTVIIGIGIVPPAARPPAETANPEITRSVFLSGAT
jgi:hypothetical protein